MIVWTRVALSFAVVSLTVDNRRKERLERINMKLKYLNVLTIILCLCSASLIFQFMVMKNAGFNRIFDTRSSRGIKGQDATRTYTLDKAVHDGPRFMFKRMTFGRTYVFGVAGANSSQNATWDVFKVYGSSDMRGFQDQNLQCCLKYKAENGSAIFKGVESIAQTKSRNYTGTLNTIHVTCPNVDANKGSWPDGVGLSAVGLTCLEKDVQYVRPYYPKKQPGVKVAIGSQVAFGNLSAELVIEWMETYKYLGVDKTICYYSDDLNKAAMKTLQYYASTGFLDLYHYEPAASDIYQRNLTDKVYQTFDDLRLVVYDSYEKMSGYTYFGIIDFDEFLIPTRNRSMAQMITDLYIRFPEAAAFTFRSLQYSLTWPPSGNSDDLILTRYAKHIAKPPQKDRPKNLYSFNEIADGGAETHMPTPVEGKIRIDTPVEEAYIRHFRKCREVRAKSDLGCTVDTNRIEDTEIVAWAEGIKDNVRYVRKRVFGKTDCDATMFQRDE